MDSNKGQKFVSLQEAAALCEYSQEYLSLRARQGKLMAKKLGRNWVTTEEWLKEYTKQPQAGAEEKTQSFISLQDASRLCEYTQEYLSLRARQGKLMAKKLGRNWVTTEEWLKEYVAKVKLLESQDKIKVFEKAPERELPTGVPLTKQTELTRRQFYVWSAKNIFTRKSLFYSWLISFGKTAARINQLIGGSGRYFDNLVFGLRAKVIYFYLRLKSFGLALQSWQIRPAIDLTEFKIILLFLLTIAGGFIFSQEAIRAKVSENISEAIDKLNDIALVGGPKLISAIPAKKDFYLENFKKEFSLLSEDAKTSAALLTKNSLIVFSDLINASADLGFQLADFLGATEKKTAEAKFLPQKILLTAYDTAGKISQAVVAVANLPYSTKQVYWEFDARNEGLKNGLREFLSAEKEKIILTARSLSEVKRVPFWAYDKYAILSGTTGRIIIDSSGLAYKNIIDSSERLHQAEILAWHNLFQFGVNGKNNFLAQLNSIKKTGSDLNKKIVNSPKLFKKVGVLVLDNMDNTGGLLKNKIYASAEVAAEFKNIVDEKLIRAFKFLRAQFGRYRYLAQSLAHKLFGQNLVLVTSEPTCCAVTSTVSSLSEEVAYLKSEMRKLKGGEITKYIKIENVKKTETIQKYETIRDTQTMVAPAGAYATPDDLINLELKMLATIEKSKTSVLNYSPNNNFYNWAQYQDDPTHNANLTGTLTIKGSSWPGADGSAGQVLTTNGAGSLSWTTSGTVGSGLTGQLPFYGADGTALTATSTLFLTSAGLVGIGTTSPYAKLTVWSGGTGSGHAFDVVNNASTTLLTILDNGSIGIATTSPSEALEINGRIYIGEVTVPAVTVNRLYNVNSNLFWNGLNLTGGGALPAGISGQTLRNNGMAWIANDFLYNDGSNIGIGTTTARSLLQVYGTRPQLTLTDASASTTPNSQHWFLSNQGGNFYIGTSSDALIATSTYLTINNGGYLGVGSTTPGALFSVGSSGQGLQINGSGTIIAGTWQGSLIANLYGGTGQNSSAWNGPVSVANGTWQATTSIGVMYGGTGIATLPSYGQLLVGNASNGYTLSATSTLGLLGSSTVSSLTANYIPRWLGSAFGDSSIYYNGTNVGIGTTTPNWNLQIANNRPFLTLSDTAGAANLKHWFLSSQGGNFYIGTSSDAYATSTISALTINSNGYLGVGTSTPSQQLSVNGNLYLTGGLYNDLTGIGSNFQILQSTGSATKWISTSTLFTTGVNVLPTGSAGQTLTYQGSAWQATSTLTVLASGLVGIGTTTPTALLALAGSAGGSTPLFLISSSTAAYATSTVFAVNSNGIISTGVWQGTAVANLYGGTGQNSSAWNGPVSVANGTWQATTTIGTMYGGTGLSAGGLMANYIPFGNGASAFATSTAFYFTNSTSILTITNASSTNFTATYASSTIGNIGTLTLPTLGTTAGSFLSVNSTGQVIATSSPLSTALAKGYFIVGNDAGAAQATSTIFISSLGNVGIGTTTPYSKLSVWGSDTGTNRLFELTNNASTSLFYATEDGNLFAPVSTATTTISGGLAVGSNALNVLQNGNVGIGTAGPGDGVAYQSILHIKTTSRNELTLEETTSGSMASMIFKNTARRWQIGADSNPDSFSIQEHASAGVLTGQWFTILPTSGNVGIGTTSPYAKLSVAGRGVFDQDIRFDYFTATSTTATSTISTGGFTVGTSQFVVQGATGNVGIGTSSPLAKLSVQGTAGQNIFNVASSTGQSLLTVDNTGQCVTGDTVLTLINPVRNSSEALDPALPDGIISNGVNSPEDDSSHITNSERERGISETRDMEPLSNRDIEYSQVRIDQIKGGEYVLSLNEKTGKLVPAKIKGLLDMGVKPIYEIETEDGKKIRTTDNHPYLVKNQNLISSISPSLTSNLLTSETIISLPGKSFGLNFFNKFFKDLTTFSKVGGWIENQTIPGNLEGGNLNGSEKSASWVRMILPSFLAKTPASISDNPLAKILTSWPSFLNHFTALNLKFSSAKNFIELFSQNSDSSHINSFGSVEQSGFDVVASQGGIVLKNFFNSFARSQHFQNQPDHNSGSSKTRLAATDLGIDRNIFADFNSLHSNFNDSKETDDLSTPLADLAKQKDASLNNNETPFEGEQNFNIIPPTSTSQQTADKITITELEKISIKNPTILGEVNDESRDNQINRGLVPISSIAEQKTLSKDDLKNAQWTRVVELSEGDEIAVANLASSDDQNIGDIKFVKIKKIEILPPEQVYDIEVEGTHNFVANGIIAHNTYISGNTGIGTTTPYSKLTTWGTGSLFEAVTNASTTVFSIGQGGATTTAFAISGLPNVLLSTNANGSVVATSTVGVNNLALAKGNFLVGNDAGVAQATSTIYISSTGNVGIGTTSPWGLLSVNANGITAGAPQFVIGSSTRTDFVVNQNGKVGIGTTSPSTKLSVGGAAGDTTGHGYFTGGLGVGVLNTTANTFRVGQCVTGDTLLLVRKRRRRKSKKTGVAGTEEAEEDISEFEYSEPMEIPITRVKPGDLVLSLNEKTGDLEWQPILALYDMGDQPVYKIITASGKNIRTTSNHPYLTKHGWIPVGDLREGNVIACPAAPALAGWFGALPKKEALTAIGLSSDFNPLHENCLTFDVKRDSIFTDSEAVSGRRQINKRFGANQGVWQLSVVAQFLLNSLLNIFGKRFQLSFASGRKLNSMHENRNENKNESYDTNCSSRSIFSNGTHPFFLASAIASLRDWIYSSLRGRFASIASMIQPAGLIDLEWYSFAESRSTNFSSISESTSSKAKVSKMNNCGAPFLSTTTPAREPFSKGKTDLGAILSQETSLAFDNFAGKSFFLAIMSKFNKWFDILSNSEESILWDRIISIEYVGIEKVWDISVKNTHNFVANGILAHNTAFMVDSTGNVGIGTSAPSAPLHVAVTSGSSASGKTALFTDSNSNLGAQLVLGWTGGGTNNKYKSFFVDSNGLNFGNLTDALTSVPTSQFTLGNTGNVGIGTTSPLTKLSIQGTAGANDVLNVASSTGASMLYVAANGNVGIGTAGPVQKLHVEGQCITGDSELSAISKKTIGKQNGVFDVEGSKLKDERIKIKDVQPGDYVYSLNQETGQLELQKITKLLDMGVKPVFKLTTESGKTIRTTGNHPYLVKTKKSAQNADLGNLDLETISLGLVPADMIADTENLSSVDKISSSIFLNAGPAGNRTPKILVPTQNLFQTGPSTASLYHNNNPQQNYDQQRELLALRKLESLAREHGLDSQSLSVDREFSETRTIWSDQSNQTSSQFSSAQYSGGNGETLRQRIDSVSDSSQRQSSRGSNLSQVGSEIELFERSADSRINPTSPQNQRATQQFDQVDQGEGEWTKVIYLQKDDEIAIVQRSTFNVQQVVWDKISSIEYVGYEQVYDIEVEGTHNFIANEILAHNTYLSGNVGIGTTSPYAKLSVAGRGVFDQDIRFDYFTATSTTATSTISTGGFTVGTSQFVVQGATGNVGIGTTGPGAKLNIYVPGGSGSPEILLTRYYDSVNNVRGSGIIHYYDDTIQDVLAFGVAGSSPGGYFDGNSPISISNAKMVLTASGNVGIGTTTPGSILTVNASNGTSNLFQVATTTNQGIFVINSAGNVGIGTAVPGANLDIVTASQASYPLLIRGNIDHAGSYSGISFGYNGNSTYQKAKIMVRGTSDSVQPEMHFLLNNIADSRDADINDAKLSILPAGNVGIGTTSPYSLLSISNSASTAANTPLFTIASTTAGTATSTLLTVLASGNVGIGTTSPYQQLSISGNLALTGGFYDSTASAGTANYILKSTGSATQWVATSTLFTAGIDSLPSGSAGQTLTYQNSAWTATSTLYVSAAGLVGIGTTGPGAKLNIYVPGGSGSPEILLTRYYDSVNNVRGSGIIHYYDDTIQDVLAFGVAGSSPGGYFDGNSPISISNAKMVLTASGNVGIGTTSPSTKLSVGGAAGDTTGHGYFTGGLGVGAVNTTAGTLYVTGQCITGDTLLPIRRRRRRKAGDKSLPASLYESEEEFDYLLVPIRDILPGDEVLSLNEAEDTFEYNRINGLLDMGEHEVFELKTKSGRIIRTTANHPYLVYSGGRNSK